MSFLGFLGLLRFSILPINRPQSSREILISFRYKILLGGLKS